MVFRLKGKNPATPSVALSPDAKALATVSANLACVISSESPDGRELSVPDLVSHLVARHQKLQDLYRDLRRESSVLQDEKTTLERTIQISQEKTQAQREEWGNQEAAFQIEINGLKFTVQRLRQCCEENNREILKQRVDLENSLKASHHALKELQLGHERNVEDMQKQNAAREADLKAQYEWNERRMKEDHDSVVHHFEDVIRSLHMDVEKRKKEFELEKMRMKDDHDSAVRHLEDVIGSVQRDVEKRKKEFELEKMQLKESHKFIQEKLKENFNDHESRLKQTHKQQQERLQKDIQSRNKALIARESYSPITDGELKSMFSSLVRQVDNLARLKWTINQSPWPDEELSRISDTPKRLQKQIMKETIWDILYEQVFCSPFRVFGTEGSVLESEWNTAFRDDAKTEDDHYKWPKPSFDAERWRYETMRRGQEALKIETSEYDPRTKLRKGFQSSMETISERLSEVLKMVSKVDEKTKQTIKEIANEAANTCVAFGTQRCRIFVVMKDLKIVEEFKEGPEREDNFVDLLTQPELRRIGDADGQALDKEPTGVAGCEGEIRRFCY